ncbi:MAG: hypothetical protein ACLR1T_11675 [Evtepia gabavorous]
MSDNLRAQLKQALDENAPPGPGLAARPSGRSPLKPPGEKGTKAAETGAPDGRGLMELLAPAGSRRP